MTTEEQWQKRLTRYDKSNLSVAEFCANECYSTASFYVWRKRLSGFTLLGATESSSLQIQIGNARIEVTQDFDAELLRSVVEALQ